MRYMQIVEARNIDQARREYLEMLQRRGVVLAPASEIYVETVHRPATDGESWLCYVALPRPHAA
jgi:hypothetical protein